MAKKFTDTDKNIYKLAYLNGFTDCQNQQKRTFELLRATNKQLWDELSRLDHAHPLLGAGSVVLSIEVVQRMISMLPAKSKRYYARRIKELQKKPQVVFST